MSRATKELWTCPRCGRQFASANQWHSCSPRVDIDSFLAPQPMELVDLYRMFEEFTRRLGPFAVDVLKSHVAFRTRMNFANVTFAKKWLDLGLVLDKPMPGKHVMKIVTYAPNSNTTRNHGHRIRLTSADQLDDDLFTLVKAAYAVGQQEHLSRR